MNYEVEVEGRTAEVSVRKGDGGWLVRVDDGPEVLVSGGQVDAAEWLFDLDGRRRSIGCHVNGDHATVQVAGHALRATITDPRDKALGLGGSGNEGAVATPMPGVIVRIEVSEGQQVTEGDVLVVVEAMKMENEYKSPIAGTVASIEVQPGQAVESNTVLVVVEPE